VKSVDPDTARDRARDIVDGFEAKDPPKPFRGILDWLGDVIRAITEPIGDAIGALFDALPAPVAWLILAVVVAGLVWLLVKVAKQAGPRRRNAGTPTTTDDVAIDPEALERDAERAAADGDHALAVRLRFRAGLIRLDRDAHAIDYHDGIGNAEVRRVVGDERFDLLADTFDEITYGDSPADGDDDQNARRSWPTVVKAAQR
jgi:hypothetical protein